MSIGKSSIARAVNASAVKTQNNDTKTISLNKFSTDSIGLLGIATTSADITSLKASVKKRGILSPVLVAATTKGEIWLIDGYARLSIAKELGIEQIDATVVRLDNKRDANNLYIEINKSKPSKTDDNIHQEKFRIVAIKDRDLPIHLL